MLWPIMIVKIIQITTFLFSGMPEEYFSQLCDRSEKHTIFFTCVMGYIWKLTCCLAAVLNNDFAGNIGTGTDEKHFYAV